MTVIEPGESLGFEVGESPHTEDLRLLADMHNALDLLHGMDGEGSQLRIARGVGFLQAMIHFYGEPELVDEMQDAYFGAMARLTEEV